MKRLATAVMAAAIAAAAVFAAQNTVVDATYIHSSWYRHWYTGDMKYVPNASNKNDDVYFRFEIKEFTGTPTTFMLQPCFFWDFIGSTQHACFYRHEGEFTFEGLETRYLMHPMSSMWMYEAANWNNIIDFMLINNYGGESEAGKNIPLPRVRVEVILVSPGEKLNAPAHWIEPADWSACRLGCKEDDAPVGARMVLSKPSAAQYIDASIAGNSLVVRTSAGTAGAVKVYDTAGRTLFRSNTRRTTHSISLDRLNATGLLVVEMEGDGCRNVTTVALR